LELHNRSELRVCMVCLGNICRSPMAAAVLNNRAAQVTSVKVHVDSAGTGPWHVGEGPNFSSEATWRKAGYDYEHIAQQFTADFYLVRDLILVMDSSNYRNVLKMTTNAEHANKVFYLRQFDPTLSHIDPTGPDAKRLEVPDPYGLADRAFEKVLEMVEDSVEGLLQVLNG
jgi:protein-tyrosine phosphatase